jgi:hypothetical protein
MRREQVGQQGRGLDHMLEVVDQEQQPPVLETCRQRLVQRSPLPLPHAQCLRDGGQDEAGVGDGGERDEPDAARERVELVEGDGDAQARLADAAGTGEGEQADVGAQQQVARGRLLVRPSDQRRERRGQVVGRARRRAERRHVGGMAVRV